MTNSVLWTPLAFGLLLAVLPRRAAGPLAVAGALVTAGLATALAIGYDISAGGLQYATDETWIGALGIHYRIGIDAVSVFLVLMTAVVWAGVVVYAAFQEWRSPRLFFFMVLLAETATLGAFVADDLLLFVLFFDLMLVPFIFLVGIWGDGDRARAAITMFTYTLVGSLLMLVGAVATGVLADSPELSFALPDLAQAGLPEGTQRWIFWLFCAAFLIKMPAVLVHGWMPAAYSSAPLPVLALLSGVLSKVAAYGFLQIVFPLYPDATIEFQEALLAISTAGILYGSIMAFTVNSARLVLGYSSIAQLGFVTLGLFALSPGGEGVQGAILQMVNHAIVVAPLFLLLGVLVARAGTDDISRLGGMALRAPILAALLLIATLGTLAMPGTANFIGELAILLGVFETKIVWAIVASTGVALAAYYGLRLFQRAMHGRLPEGLASREINLREAAGIVPLIACVVALALYPKLVFNPLQGGQGPPDPVRTVVERCGSAPGEREAACARADAKLPEGSARAQSGGGR